MLYLLIHIDDENLNNSREYLVVSTNIYITFKNKVQSAEV